MTSNGDRVMLTDETVDGEVERCIMYETGRRCGCGCGCGCRRFRIGDRVTAQTGQGRRAGEAWRLEAECSTAGLLPVLTLFGTSVAISTEIAIAIE